MGISTILQVAIGIIFVWIILAVITSQIQGYIASLLKMRANMLEETIGTMLGNPELRQKVYDHPLIQGLHTQNGKRKPGGIPQDKFALVLFEQVMNSGVSVGETVDQAKDSFKLLKEKVTALKNSDGNDELKGFATSLDTLLIGVEEKADAISEARTRVESWFNDSMDRLGGEYYRRMQRIAIVIGLLVAGLLNVDTAAIATQLWTDPVVREAVVAQASQLQESDIQAGEAPSAEEIAKTVEKLDTLSLPIGWSADTTPKDANGWLTKIVGILLSGMAAAQGAPYWFDLMRKLLSRK